MRSSILKKITFYGLMGVFLSFSIPTSIAMAAGLKKVVAVSRFENKTSIRSQGAFDLNQGMADQLTDALVQSGQFVVLERQTLGDVMQEQDMANTDRFQKARSARTGKLTSAQILVKGTVTEFETLDSRSNSGISFGGFRIGGRKHSVHIGLIIRLIDTTTGEVIDSQRVEGKARSKSVDLGINYGGVGFGSNSSKATPLGKATQIAIDNAVEYVAGRLKNIPFQGRVIKLKGNIVYVSAGDKHGTNVGDVFNIYSVGEELIDPNTGEILGVDEVKIGKVKIIQVQEKFSKTSPVGDLRGVKIGDTVRFEKET